MNMRFSPRFDFADWGVDYQTGDIEIDYPMEAECYRVWDSFIKEIGLICLFVTVVLSIVGTLFSWEVVVLLSPTIGGITFPLLAYIVETVPRVRDPLMKHLIRQCSDAEPYVKEYVIEGPGKGVVLTFENIGNLFTRIGYTGDYKKYKRSFRLYCVEMDFSDEGRIVQGTTRSLYRWVAEVRFTEIPRSGRLTFQNKVGDRDKIDWSKGMDVRWSEYLPSKNI